MKLKNIEDIYELSPTQKGMLFHSLSAPDSGFYFQQFQCVLGGPLDVEALEGAWQQAIDRHPLLRTSFFWEGIDKPMQVVRQSAQVKVETTDWSDLSEAEQRVRLRQYLDSDRRRGFELRRLPLMRLTLFRLGSDKTRFVWSQHHLQLDGWSTSLLFKEVFLHNEALLARTPLNLPRPRPYRDYIAWLQRQSLTQAEQFWRRRLSGFSAPTPFVVDVPRAGNGDAGGQGQQEVRLSAEQTAMLREAARSRQLTVNAVVQGAWALLLLSRYSGEADVVFGATVAGRPAELSGVEQMLGLFINTLPMRVRVDEEAGVGAWLKEIQAEGAQAREYEYSPLVEVAGRSELPRGVPLFESLLVFDNYPFDASLAEQIKKRTGLDVTELRVVEQTNFPLSLTMMPGDELTLLMRYEHARFDAATISRMLRHLERLLKAVGGDVLCYQDLAGQLDPAQPVYGLLAKGLDGEQEAHSRIEDMAAEYIRAIREVQPEGPYHLCGWSMGGVISFEMSHQLDAQGESVSFLGLIDSVSPLIVPAEEDELILIEVFARNLGLIPQDLSISRGDMARMSLEEIPSYLGEQAKASNLLPAHLLTGRATQLYHVFKTNLEAFKRYQPRHPAGRITLWTSEETTSIIKDPTHGWGNLSVEKIEVFRMPGEHHTILRPPIVETLASQLETQLDKNVPVRASGQSSS
ncbi:MAG: condensation domain-containing protein [Acidobacteria bacterium]|nr:condensation domain-containing protein [Acidobacteriota bacterium]